MKNILLILSFLFLCAGDNSDDEVISDGLISLGLSEDFVLDEKWFLESAVAESEVDINGDGTATLDLSSQFPECDLDSYYEFERFQPDIVVLVDGANECPDNFERFGGNAMEFEVQEEDSKLFLNLRGDDLLGGINSSDDFNQINGLFKVQFLISEDSSFKIIKGEVALIVDSGDIVIIDYRLKAQRNDRPE